MRRSAEPKFVVGIFRLTERPGPASAAPAPATSVAVAFRIYRGHITSWVRADDELADADADADAGAEPDADAEDATQPRLGLR